MLKRLLRIFIPRKSPLEALQKQCECQGMVNVDGYTTIQKWTVDSRIVIGDDVTLTNRAETNLAGVVHECRFVTQRPGAEIHIGAHSGLSGVTIMCAKKVSIGKHVGIGANVAIYDNDMHAINPYLRAFDNDANIKAKEIVIDDYAWIGANSIILKGVHVGKGAVVGAGSVVTNDVPDYTIYAGNPARFVKEIVVTQEQKEQLESKSSGNKKIYTSLA